MAYEQIWAPWRLQYIQQGEDQPEADVRPAALLPGADPACFLCRCAAEGDDRQQLVVCRGECSIALLNRYPYNNGHLLIAPRNHVARLDGLNPQQQSELAATLTRMVGLLEAVLHPEGFNIGLNLGRVAGAGVPGHLHWHIVPRWGGDTNFMPVTAAVRIIPQSLEALWEALVCQSTKSV